MDAPLSTLPAPHGLAVAQACAADHLDLGRVITVDGSHANEQPLEPVPHRNISIMIQLELHGLKLVAHDLRPVAHDLGPELRDLRPVPHDLGPVAYDLEPEPYDLGPELHDLEPELHPPRFTPTKVRQ